MFTPKTKRIEEISENKKQLIEKLDAIFNDRTIIYIDYANIKPWSNKLRFHIDTKRLKQFLDSFNQIRNINFYHGTIDKDVQSEDSIKNIKDWGYDLHTKPVKIINISIDTTSLSDFENPSLLKDLVRKPLLQTFSLEKIGYLNTHLQDLNKKNIKTLQDKKCNFDVEIGVNMLLDLERNMGDTFVLWSGDSDFYDPILQLLKNGKDVVLFGTAGRISRELNDLKKFGLKIFDIRDIKDFICWPRELGLKNVIIKSTKDSIAGAP